MLLYFIFHCGIWELCIAFLIPMLLNVLYNYFSKFCEAYVYVKVIFSSVFYNLFLPSFRWCNEVGLILQLHIIFAQVTHSYADNIATF